MVRAVIDTNVLVSALIHDGKPRKLILELLNRHTVILSQQMLIELAEVAGRDKFHVTGSQVERFLSMSARAFLVGKFSCFLAQKRASSEERFASIL